MNTLKAAIAAGIKISSFEVDPGNGKIVVVGKVGGEPADYPNGAAGISLDDDLDRELAEFEAGHGQG